MTDPLHLAALDFLTSSPKPTITLSPATAERRRAMLDEAGAALVHAREMWERPTNPAHEAALQVFALAADVWREYLAREADPHRASLNLHTWAASWAVDTTPDLQPPLSYLLADQFPQVGEFVSTAYSSGILTLPDAGRAAAWYAVYTLAALCAGPGFEDNEPEDQVNEMLSSLRTLPGRVMN